MSADGLQDRMKDTTGLSQFITDSLVDVEEEFFQGLIDEVSTRAGITKLKDKDQRDLIVRRLREDGINLRAGGVEDGVLKVITEVTRQSKWAPILDTFVAANAIELPLARRRLVLRALDKLPLTPGPNLEQTVAQVLADVSDGGGTDPVQLTAPTGRLSPWDFQVDLFDDAAAQIVLAENVRAAGALMWCYDIGERMGVYRLTDALVYRWWIGLVDFADADLTSELYRYYKLRDERPTEEERFLLYRRILAVGDAEVSERVPVNEDFPALWRTLMEEVATYIDRSETSLRERVNRQGVEQAVQELQYNLTERMAGMALTQVTEMYNQLRQTDRTSGTLGGLDILGHPEVVAQLSSGRRKDEWSVIERLSKEEFSVSPNVSAMRTSAVEGFKVTDFIATFAPGTFAEDRFDAFIASAKAWILAQQVAGQGLLMTPDRGGDDDGTGEYGDDEFGEFDGADESAADDTDTWAE
jgi:hypothetical protein